MSRLPGVPAAQAGPLVRLAYAVTRRRFGRDIEPLAVSAHHRPTMIGMAAFETAVDASKRVPYRLKILAELKVATLAGCEYCIDIGSWLARGHGVTEDELRAFHDYRTSELFSELDRLVIDYAAGMSATPVDVSDAMVADLRARLGDSGLVELTNVIAWENWRARFNWALGIGASGFSEGAFCPRPESAQPGQ